MTKLCESFAKNNVSLEKSKEGETQVYRTTDLPLNLIMFIGITSFTKSVTLVE